METRVTIRLAWRAPEYLPKAAANEEGPTNSLPSLKDESIRIG